MSDPTVFPDVQEQVLLSASWTLRSLSNELLASGMRVSNIRTEGAWVGEGSDAFAGAMTRIRGPLPRLVTRIDQMSTVLGNGAAQIGDARIAYQAAVAQVAAAGMQNRSLTAKNAALTSQIRTTTDPLLAAGLGSQVRSNTSALDAAYADAARAQVVLTEQIAIARRACDAVNAALAGAGELPVVVGAGGLSPAMYAAALKAPTFDAGVTSLMAAASGTGAAPTAVDAAGLVAAQGDSLVGANALSAAQIAAWYHAHYGAGNGRLQGTTVENVIAMYLAEGKAEGIRGDLAFVQAVLETGGFRNNDTALNNYAGIAHPDNAARGQGFASPQIGVRAQIQLLKKVTAGNAIALANPNVAPKWGGRSTTTVGGLARNWASDPRYATSIMGLYGSMAKSAGA